MLTTNNNCTKISYSGDGILTNTDLSNVSNYNITVDHNGVAYNELIPINIIDGSDDTYTLPCGIVKRTECTELIECSSTPTTEDIIGDVSTSFAAPVIGGYGWLNNYKEEEEYVIELSNNSSFRELTLGGGTILTTTSNTKYCASYANVASGDSPSANARLLQLDLEDAFLTLGDKAIVDVEFNNIKQNYKITIKFLGTAPINSTITIAVTEYLHSTTSTNVITTVYAPTVKTYTRDRVYLYVNSYDASNTRSAYWTLEDEGGTVETIKSSDKYLVYYKDFSLIGGHTVWYNIITQQGVVVRYKYQVVASIGTYISVGVTPAGAYEEDGTTATTQVFVSYGTGEVIGTRILSCSVSTNENETCSTYWDITSEFFSCGNITQLADGIYTVTITTEYDDGTCQVKKECIFIGCNIKCRLVEFLSENKQRTDLVAIYQALVLGNNCNLSCEELYELYEYLNEQLGNGTTTTTSNCGCV